MFWSGPVDFLPKSNIYSINVYLISDLSCGTRPHHYLCSILEIDCTHCWLMWLNWWVVIVKMRKIYVRGIMCVWPTATLSDKIVLQLYQVICGKSKMRSEGKWASKLNFNKRCFMLNSCHTSVWYTVFPSGWRKPIITYKNQINHKVTVNEAWLINVKLCLMHSSFI